MNATFHLGPAKFPLGIATTAPDSYAFIERLGDHEQVTFRVRTEEWVPAAYAEVWALSRQFEVAS